uniref:Uncharacterized protein n=1 Tax=Solanum tuberosum TaxID=4113 RepID=M1DBX2_SOLTU
MSRGPFDGAWVLAWFTAFGCVLVANLRGPPTGSGLTHEPCIAKHGCWMLLLDATAGGGCFLLLSAGSSAILQPSKPPAG